MAGTKLSPRQRMINMMYLVLTALLALNVSKEVLNSFFEVNKGIERTTTNFKKKNNTTYAEFNSAAINNPEKYKKVRDKAFTVKRKADALVDSIQRMKYELVLKVDRKIYLGDQKDIRDSVGKLIEDKAITKPWDSLSKKDRRKPIGELNRKDDRNSSGELFYNDKATEENPSRSTILKKEMEVFRGMLLKFSNGNRDLRNSIQATFNFEDIKKSGGETVEWERYNFYDMPAVGALTLLSKMQADVRNAEADLIEYLKKDIDSKSLKFGEAEGVQIPKSNFVIRGDSFKSTIFVAAKQDGQDPEIFVGDVDTTGGKYKIIGDSVKVKVVNGKGMFAKRTSKLGNEKWGGIIRMKTEKGTKTYPFGGEYLVAPKTAVASPTNMNVLYVAVDNPITVAVAGYSASQVTATTRNGTIKSVNKSKGEWIVNPTKQTNKSAPIIDLYVTIDGKRKSMGSVEFKVKDVPEPQPKAAGISKKVVSKGDLRAAQMLIAEMKDFYFDRNAVSYRIVSYDISYVNTKGQFKKEIKGYKFDAQVLEAINNTKPGGSITFSNITVRRKGVKGTKTLPADLMYTLK